MVVAWVTYEFYLHVRMEKELIIAPFIDILGVLKLVGWINKLVPIVLMAPDTIMRLMIVSLKVLVISDIVALFSFYQIMIIEANRFMIFNWIEKIIKRIHKMN